MALGDLLASRKKEKKTVLGVIANFKIKEEFKGEVFDKDVRFPKDLGAEHPFDFVELENLYKKFGFVTATIDKYIDNIIADFNVKCDNDNAQAVIDEFIEQTTFKVTMREWLKEALVKGNGFMELDLDNTKVRVLNANNMYVKRDNKGVVKKYNQFTGNMGTFSRNSTKLIPLEPNQVAHLPINIISDEAYGYGIIYSNMKEIERLIANLCDMQKLVGRKAGAPYHVKVGVPGEAVAQADIDSMQEKLTYLNNRTEWTTDANVDIKLLDFGDIGKNFDTPVNTSLKLLYAGFQVPEVYYGSGQLNEGIALVQETGFRKRCTSIREGMGKVMEEKIFKPLLLRQGNEQFDAKIDIEWELPSDDEINKRIEKITGLLGMGLNISENLNRMLQIELANAMGIKDAELYLRPPEVGLDDEKDEEEKLMNPLNPDSPNNEANKEKSGEEKKEEKIQQPEVPGAKPGTRQMDEDILTEIELPVKEYADMTVTEFLDIPVSEIDGFVYSDYMAKAVKITKKDSFEKLRALSEMDVDLGLLEKDDVNKLRIILKDGFKKNKTMLQIENDIRDSLDLRDRKILRDGNQILVKSAAARPNSIARTEVVRLSNLALQQTYKERGVTKYRWLAAVSDRTCDICMGLNGNVYEINEMENPPAHPGCRCSIIPVVLE